MSELRKLSIIIPAYNEESTVAEVVHRVYAVDLGDLDKEIILVNDGSSDATSRILQQLALEYANLRIYDMPINMGKGAAVRVGMSLATGDIILIQDADLELDPCDHVVLVQPLRSGQADVVYGSRFLNGNQDVPRRTRWANRFLTWLTNILFGGHLTDMETAYKVFRRDILCDLRLTCVSFDFEPEITAQFLRHGYSITEVPVKYSPRTVADGKKINRRDGVDAVYTLLRCRFWSN